MDEKTFTKAHYQNFHNTGDRIRTYKLSEGEEKVSYKIKNQNDTGPSWGKISS